MRGKVNVGLAILLAIAMLWAMSLVVVARPAEVPAPAPAARPAEVVRTNILLLSGNGVTATATGTGRIVGFYNNADCFFNVDVTDAQTVTFALAGSADDSHYATIVTLSAISSDQTTFTRTVIYGDYLHATATLGGSNPVTYTVRCTIKA